MSDSWCPTQSGTGSAWEPQWRAKVEDKWERVKTVRGPWVIGVPNPLFQGGVIEQIGLFGYEQAMALAWKCAAQAAAYGLQIEVRVCEYELQYEIKARKRGEAGSSKLKDSTLETMSK